jgi:simple sugar transport system substrate-binding protein
MLKNFKRTMIASVAVTLCAFPVLTFATEPTAKWCEGVRIAAFPGGPQGGVFANNVYNGFKQAELDLGPDVTYYFSDWDPNKMLKQIQQEVETLQLMDLVVSPRLPL